MPGIQTSFKTRDIIVEAYWITENVNEYQEKVICNLLVIESALITVY